MGLRNCNHDLVNLYAAYLSLIALANDYLGGIAKFNVRPYGIGLNIGAMPLIIMSSQHLSCIDKLRGFYRQLVLQWLDEAFSLGVDLNEHLRRKGRAGIRSDMDNLFNRGFVQIRREDFCPCLQELYKELGSQFAAVVSSLLDLILPGLPMARDVVELIIAAALEYCGSTIPFNDIMRAMIIILLIAALATIITSLLQERKGQE